MANKRIDDATRPDLTTLESGYKLLVDSTTGGTKKMDLSVVKNVDNHTDGTTNKVFTAIEKTKLAGIATGATVYTDAMADARVTAGITGKVDKVAGKQLSTEDYTTTEKSKLSGIASGAEVNVNADWNSSSGDSQILNKPALGTAASINYWTGTQIEYDANTVKNGVAAQTADLATIIG